MIAILDALGASSYTDDEVQKFLESRQNVLNLLEKKIGRMPERIRREEIEVFTFNDTIFIAYMTKGQQPTIKQIDTFFTLLRKFFVDSLSNKILFRGSVAIGTFYVDKDSNTVMGQAVTDAAAWYNRADWIGIQATPRGTLIIQRWVEKHSTPKSHLMIDYDVPLKEGKVIRVKAVNWPKVFYVKNLTPCSPGEGKRAKLLQFLSEHPVPLGTERKFQNAIAFFDYAVKEMKIHNKANRTVQRT